MAAVLAAGEGAVLSHRSAAELWGLREGARIPVEVTVPRARRPRPGIQFHRSLLPFDEVTIHDGIPVTTVPRTHLDLGIALDSRQVERALNEADVLRLWDRLSPHDLLQRYPRRAGSLAVRTAFDRRQEGSTVARSELEEEFLRFVDRHRFPRPEINASIEAGGGKQIVDCLWRTERVTVELDSRQFHLTVEAFEADRERDRRLSVEGWRPIRITWRQLKRDLRLVEDIARLLAASPS